MLRLSSLLPRTLRDDPADAEVPSHRLLVRAGYVRRVAPGIYSWLPLGRRVLERVTTVVREEMDAIGGQEVLLPTLVPEEHYDASGRAGEYGDLLFRLRDRRGAAYVLGPTHEEMFALLVKGECASYRELPLILYQVQAKYRDEARPRAGVLRAREFLMKDSYSFDLDEDGLQASYALHREAYERIFTRLGVEYTIVSAVSGAMGGSRSDEFLAPTPVGEDTFVSCAACGYAANTEAAEIRAPGARDPAAPPPLEVLDTPGTPTIATLVEHLRARGTDVSAAGTLKNVVLRARAADGTVETLVVGVPGDRDVDVKRLEANLAPATVEAADVAGIPGLVKGYIGPQGLPPGIRYVVDPLVVRGSAWVTGANEEGRHAANVVMGRDFEPAGTVPAVEVRSGDPCGRCGSRLAVGRGVEIGHVFQLGRKYTDAFEVDVPGADGRPVRLTMGSYGVGISRLVAAIAEQTHDADGLVWPPESAPADVHVLAVGRGAQPAEAERLAHDLEDAGLRVVLDDRGHSAGASLTDAELIGVPTIVVVGRGLAEGNVEVRDRRSGSTALVPVGDAVSAVVARGVRFGRRDPTPQRRDS